jgi:hypothetical protein
MDISLHDAAEFMRNSQMNKDSIVTSNLTVLENALLDINKVKYKTDNIYTSDLQQYPPVDLSSDDFLTSISPNSNIITTQVSNQSYGNGLYKFMSSETVNVEQHNSISFNVFSDIETSDSEIYPSENGKYSEGNYNGSYSLNNDNEFKGLWFSLELPYEIILTGIEFAKTNTENETSFYCKIYIQDAYSNYILITKNRTHLNNNLYTLNFNNVKKSNKYFVIFQLIDYFYPPVRISYLKINNFRFIGYTQTNIISFPNILQNKQDKLTTDYGLQIVDNNIQFDNVFMQMQFGKFNTNYNFTLSRLPYKFISEVGSLEPWKYRIFNVSIIDNVNENLIYSYIVKVGTNDQVTGDYIIEYVPVFSYFSTSTITKINYSIKFDDWVTIIFQRTTAGDDDECSVEIHKNCTVNIVSR